MNKLYFGDNLEILREMDDERVHLICTDPPFLTFMGPRLAEMHRVLTPTGSIYLHCDPTANHYLKAVLDVVFGRVDLQNTSHKNRPEPSHNQDVQPF